MRQTTRADRRLARRMDQLMDQLMDRRIDLRLDRRSGRSRRGAGAAIAAALIAASVAFSGAAALAEGPSPRPAKLAFGAAAAPSNQAPEAIGGYAKGCLAGGATLPADGPGWQAMRLSRNRLYAHPAMIAFIERLSDRATTELGWPGLLIGDLAQPRGGPMLTGHASHQIGLDADIWLKPAPRRRLTEREREGLSATNFVAANRLSAIPAFDADHRRLLRAASEDPAVARIFVNPALKKALCDQVAAAGEPDAWLRKIRPWWGHDHHFHVRLNCPEGSPNCRPQQPPKPGSGCGAEVESWLEGIRNPKPRAPGAARKPKPPLTLADLPASCAAALGAAPRR
ncbi:MAG: penicillin-insensitive murein endopeptidase [Pseudomonadota bacterium]